MAAKKSTTKKAATKKKGAASPMAKKAKNIDGGPGPTTLNFKLVDLQAGGPGTTLSIAGHTISRIKLEPDAEGNAKLTVFKAKKKN